MKKKLFDPGFEFIFAIGVIIMLMLPPLVMAQQPPQTTSKQLKVIIQNNDTTINGKNIKQLSKTEREKALEDMAEINDRVSISTTDMHRDLRKYMDTTRIVYVDPRYGKQEIAIPRIDPRWMKEHMRSKRGHTEMSDSTRAFSFKTDTAFELDKASFPKISWDLRKDGMDGFERKTFAFHGPESRNSQSFSYSNTNKDGFSTHVNYHTGDANREAIKRMTGTEKVELNINDLMLTPSFTTGKTNLSFTLTEKGSAEVLFKDNEGKILWNDKTTGSFSRSFELPQNGIYYLQIKQGNKFGLRRIAKEQ